MDRDGSGLSVHARASPELKPWRATGPRVYKGSLTWSHGGQPALATTTSLPARARGQPALVSTKAVPKLDHQGTTSPTGIQISPSRFIKKNCPSWHALRKQEHHLGLTKATGHRVRTETLAQLEGETTTRRSTPVERLTTSLENLKVEIPSTRVIDEQLHPTCTTQDVVTSMSGSAVKRAAERPPVTAKGVLKKKTVPRVGAHSRLSGRCPFSSLCTWGSNVPRFQCPVASTRGSNVSGFQCPKGGETLLS